MLMMLAWVGHQLAKSWHAGQLMLMMLASIMGISWPKLGPADAHDAGQHHEHQLMLMMLLGPGPANAKASS